MLLCGTENNKASPIYKVVFGSVLAKLFAFCGSFLNLYISHKGEVLSREKPTRNTPYTTVVRAPTMADFVVEKYDGGVKKPSQSIKIYRKSLKSLRNVIK